MKVVRKQQVDYNYRVLEKRDSDNKSTFFVQTKHTWLWGLSEYWTTEQNYGIYDTFDMEFKTMKAANEYIQYLKDKVEPIEIIHYVI
jgi:hypothetical protein